jgi:hypothetical protein
LIWSKGVKNHEVIDSSTSRSRSKLSTLLRHPDQDSSIATVRESSIGFDKTLKQATSNAKEHI